MERHFPNSLQSRCVLHLMANDKKGCRYLGFSLTKSQILAQLFKISSYKYIVQEFNAEVEKIKAMS